MGPLRAEPRSVKSYCAISQMWPAGSVKLAVRTPHGPVHRPIEQRYAALSHFRAECIDVIHADGELETGSQPQALAPSVGCLACFEFVSPLAHPHNQNRKHARPWMDRRPTVLRALRCNRP